MSYIPVKDLKKSRDLWTRLERDRQLVITKDGQPRAIMIGIEPDELEDVLSEIRRALFSSTVGRVRARARKLPAPDKAIDAAIWNSRNPRT